ncbi:acriflavin resistance protein [Alkaliphilus metalliredigens QYMF]|uniref:Acriflavin resistance protein n=1 Tax=Alkaliphilus metalliredigens (strain QYMF) TaxID=293826 RepID=A6TNE7_ALKMQ|nr:efflux RND transporter permease subunit [Alkaliphilus metalliredigens]ABR47715.1 acriflavin resistance protein [Alkaliphilus metalliredigens QYMF]
MNPSKLAVKRPVTTVVAMLIIILLGTISLTRLPIELYPSMEIPVAAVITSYSGAGPHEVENLITRPIEEAMATVRNVDIIHSTSAQGSSVVPIIFKAGTDMDMATLEMREEVDLIKGALPAGSTDPMVIRLDPNADPIMYISLTNGEDLTSLQVLAEETIKPRFERIEGVAAAGVSGGYTNEIQIKTNQRRLDNYGISLSQLAQIINASNMNLPGGTINDGEKELPVRAMGEFRSIDEIKEVPVTLPTGSIITLKDIAEVELTHQDIKSISRTNGKASINISIQKQPGSNTVEVAALIHAEISKLQNEYADIAIDITLDESKYITNSINSLTLNVILGGIFAIMVLYLFLRNIRTTLIIGTSIPISVIATFGLMYFSGITLNMISLGGLALGVGMLVDNSIVVLENIYRFRVEGYSRTEAAVKGTLEVAQAVAAPTLTTIAVFLPILFVEDMMVNIYFGEMALAVIFSLIASLVVSLTLIPMLSSQLLKVDSTDEKERKGIRKGFKLIYDAFDRAFSSIEKAYKKLLTWSLGHRRTTILLALIVFLGSLSSMLFVGVELFPASDEGMVDISVSLPRGAEIHEINEVLLEVEESIASIEEIETVVASIGGGGATGEARAVRTGGQRGSIMISFADMKERNRTSEEIADEIRDLVKDIPGAEISVSAAAGGFALGIAGDPISISIKGDSLENLQEISQDFKRIIESVEGTREITTSFTEAMSEVQVHIDRYSAATYGLTTSQVANNMRNAVSGITATRYKLDGDEIDVVLKAEDSVTESLSNMQQMSIQTAAGGNIPLNQVANVSIERSPFQIDRIDQQRVVTVTGEIGDRDLQSIMRDIDGALKEYPLPPGYTYEIGGQGLQMGDTMNALLFALVMAIGLVYLVMAAQFESWMHPFIIILSVPTALAGGLLGLFITGKSLGLTAMIGIVMLAGIVVNNAIVLLDYINTLRAAGKDRTDAITTAGPIRLRPILMTTATTVLGLLPVAIGIGEGAEAQAPMGIVVIAGLLLSTILTLVLIPTVYTLVDDFSTGIKNKLKGTSKK